MADAYNQAREEEAAEEEEIDETVGTSLFTS